MDPVRKKLSAISNSVGWEWIFVVLLMILSTYQDHRIDNLEKRLSQTEETEKLKVEKVAKPAVLAQPKRVPLKAGDIIRSDSGPSSIDELGRDMTIVSSLKNQPGDACWFTGRNEAITILEVREAFVFVEYEVSNIGQAPDRNVLLWDDPHPIFCTSGDVGILSIDRVEWYRWFEEDRRKSRREQREEVGRIRALFLDLLPPAPAEGI